MSDRTRITRAVESLTESAPSMSNAEFEAKRAVGTRSVRVVNLNLNVNTAATLLDSLIAAQCSDNCVVEGVAVTSPVAMTTSTTNYTVLTVWKRSADGATISQIAELNTANIANVNAFVPIEVNFANTVAVNLANAEVAALGSIGYNLNVTGTGGTLGTASVLQVTLRQK